MSRLPPVGSSVHAMIPGPLAGPVDLRSLRVISVFPSGEGVVGFYAQNSWECYPLGLTDEGIRWTRSDDPADWDALRAAFALAESH